MTASTSSSTSFLSKNAHYLFIHSIRLFGPPNDKYGNRLASLAEHFSVYAQVLGWHDAQVLSWQGKEGVKRIRCPSLPTPGSKSSRSVEKTSVNNSNSITKNYCSKNRGPHLRFFKITRIILFIRCKILRPVDLYRDIRRLLKVTQV